MDQPDFDLPEALLHCRVCNRDLERQEYDREHAVLIPQVKCTLNPCQCPLIEYRNGGLAKEIHNKTYHRGLHKGQIDNFESASTSHCYARLVKTNPNVPRPDGLVSESKRSGHHNEYESIKTPRFCDGTCPKGPHDYQAYNTENDYADHINKHWVCRGTYCTSQNDQDFPNAAHEHFHTNAREFDYKVQYEQHEGMPCFFPDCIHRRERQDNYAKLRAENTQQARDRLQLEFQDRDHLNRQQTRFHNYRSLKAHWNTHHAQSGTRKAAFLAVLDSHEPGGRWFSEVLHAFKLAVVANPEDLPIVVAHQGRAPTSAEDDLLHCPFPSCLHGEIRLSKKSIMGPEWLFLKRHWYEEHRRDGQDPNYNREITQYLIAALKVMVEDLSRSGRQISEKLVTEYGDIHFWVTHRDHSKFKKPYKDHEPRDVFNERQTEVYHVKQDELMDCWIKEIKRRKIGIDQAKREEQIRQDVTQVKKAKKALIELLGAYGISDGARNLVTERMNQLIAKVQEAPLSGADRLRTVYETPLIHCPWPGCLGKFFLEYLEEHWMKAHMPKLVDESEEDGVVVGPSGRHGHSEASETSRKASVDRSEDGVVAAGPSGHHHSQSSETSSRKASVDKSEGSGLIVGPSGQHHPESGQPSHKEQQAAIDNPILHEPILPRFRKTSAVVAPNTTTTTMTTAPVKPHTTAVVTPPNTYSAHTGEPKGKGPAVEQHGGASSSAGGEPAVVSADRQSIASLARGQTVGTPLGSRAIVSSDRQTVGSPPRSGSIVSSGGRQSAGRSILRRRSTSQSGERHSDQGPAQSIMQSANESDPALRSYPANADAHEVFDKVRSAAADVEAGEYGAHTASLVLRHAYKMAVTGNPPKKMWNSKLFKERPVAGPIGDTDVLPLTHELRHTARNWRIMRTVESKLGSQDDVQRK